MLKIGILVCLFLCLSFNINQDTVIRDTPSDSIEYGIVKRIIDGDTFELENGERVRLIGIDTPEKYDSDKLNKDIEMSSKDRETIVQLGLMASDYADSILSGKEVILIPDSTNSNRDRYKRLLRYVYYNDTIFFNLQIIKDGFAYAYTKYPFVYMEEFRQAERDARENRKGLWGNVDFDELKPNKK